MGGNPEKILRASSLDLGEGYEDNKMGQEVRSNGTPPSLMLQALLRRHLTRVLERPGVARYRLHHCASACG